MNTNNRGLFITVEGIEGAGKSAVMQFMKNYLQQHDIDCVTTREFGGTEIAEAIRQVLLNYHYQEKMCQDTEILLAFASRAQHLANLIVPTIEQGKWVLCDRFTDSTYAYQGYGRGASRERIATIEEWTQHGIKPNYTLLLDVDTSIGFERLQTRNNGLDRIESEELQFFRRVREGYLDLAAQEPQRFQIIDAARTQEEVLIQLEKILGKIVADFKNRVNEQH